MKYFVKEKGSLVEVQKTDLNKMKKDSSIKLKANEKESNSKMKVYEKKTLLEEKKK